MFKPLEYINPYILYTNTYKNTPSRFIFYNIQYEALLDKIKSDFNIPSDKIIQSELYNNRVKKIIEIDFYYIDFGENLAVCYEYSGAFGSTVQILYDSSSDFEKIKKLKELIKKHVKNAQLTNKINLLCSNYSGFYLHESSINHCEINLEFNYNDSLLPISKKIEERLKKKNDKGIIFLYGKPGTGKSHYLRYLIGKIEKEVIYVTPDVAQKIGSPDFLSFLIEHPESVLIIEDAENVIQERSQIRTDVVSNLLNMSDGLLSDCLNIQIICTFNLDIKNVDKAFLRKGRLIAQYEFTALTKEKAQKLIDHLGYQYKVEKPMTLAEIYNINENDFGTNMYETKSIGFK
ncbi:MAG: AAA family ATPase [Bacteroidia bacterium]